MLKQLADDLLSLIVDKNLMLALYNFVKYAPSAGYPPVFIRCVLQCIDIVKRNQMFGKYWEFTKGSVN